MKKILFAFLLLLSQYSYAGNKIRIYFNHPVDNTVSTGVNAVYLPSSISDTLVAYINRAKYTIDVAVYNYTSTAPVGSAIASAINNAYSRGVVVRWIYDGGQSNSGLPLLNSSIPTLASPTTTDYTIMHNKFMVVDASSSNPNDAIVWTGSTNWNTQQFNYDFNNVIIVQDSALAHAYRDQFNMMWGGSGATPNSSASRFGQYKTDMGRHNFTVEGKSIQLYFSPSDGTNAKIKTAINTANKDLYFGLYSFTDNDAADAIVARNASGVYCAGIFDESAVSASGSEYNTLNSGLGSSKFKVYNGGYLYHNKMLIVDPSDRCSNPLVLTGSHNWTFSADTKNDENTLIIYNDTIANIYYQSFRADFAVLSGTLSTITGCPTEVSASPVAGEHFTFFPNPGNGDFTLSCSLTSAEVVSVDVLDMAGRNVYSIAAQHLSQGEHRLPVHIAVPGSYIARVVTLQATYLSRLVVAGK